MSKKTKTAKKAVPKTIETPTETKAAKPKVPRENREGWGTFALKMPVPEREGFHVASGKAGASKFARIVLNAFTNEDVSAFQSAIKEARETRS